MNSTFASLPAIPREPWPDLSKHVNYTLGMLLGVDDFKQEFAYLAGRDRWLAHDLLGYGVVNGLRVSCDTDEKGPRVKVASGAALSPGGQLIRVRLAECIYLNDWLAAKRDVVATLISSEPCGPLSLFIVLKYRECETDRVPVPGGPCTSDEESMAASRIADSFELGLSLEIPQQPEEDSVREFARWLNQIQITDAPGTFVSLGDFEAALRAAIPDPALPAGGGLVLPFGSPAGLRVLPADARQYLRAALRIWVSEIRPLVHPPCAQAPPSCCGATGAAATEPDDGLMLAKLSVPVINVGPGQNWRVDEQNPIEVNESVRPFLAPLRLLQEIIWFPGGSAGTWVQSSPGAKSVSVVAAGIVGPATSRAPVLGGLSVTAPAPGSLRVTFPAYKVPDSTFQYIVKAMAVHINKVPAVALDSFDAEGVLLRVGRGAAAVPKRELDKMQFVIEISRIE